MTRPKVSLPRKGFPYSLSSSAPEYVVQNSPPQSLHSHLSESNSSCYKEDPSLNETTLSDNLARGDPANNSKSIKSSTSFKTGLNCDFNLETCSDYLNLVFADDLSEKLYLNDPNTKSETQRTSMRAPAPAQKLEHEIEPGVEPEGDDFLDLDARPYIEDVGKIDNPEQTRHQQSKRDSVKSPSKGPEKPCWIVMTTDLTR